MTDLRRSADVRTCAANVGIRCIAVAYAEAENVRHRSQFQFPNWKSRGSNFVGYQRRASKWQLRPHPLLFLLFLRLIERTIAAGGGLEQQEQQEQQGPRGRKVDGTRGSDAAGQPAYNAGFTTTKRRRPSSSIRARPSSVSKVTASLRFLLSRTRPGPYR